MMKVRGDIGMLFQESALFDSLTVADNVGYRLYEETDMPADQVRRRVEEVLGFIGLREYIDRMPSELSGGQRRRVAIARAMAARPQLLLFDEPTSGLDPMTAKTVDDEIIKLRDVEHVTSIVVTHQLQDAFYIATHEAVQQNGHLAIVPAQDEQGRRSRIHHAQGRANLFRGLRRGAAGVDRPVSEGVPVGMGSAALSMRSLLRLTLNRGVWLTALGLADPEQLRRAAADRRAEHTSRRAGNHVAVAVHHE